MAAEREKEVQQGYTYSSSVIQSASNTHLVKTQSVGIQRADGLQRNILSQSRGTSLYNDMQLATSLLARIPIARLKK